MPVLHPVPGTEAYSLWRRAPHERERMRDAIAAAPAAVRKRHPADEIVKATAKRHGLSVKSIRCYRRSERFVLARQEVYYLVRVQTKLNYHEIARRVGRTHATVISGIRAYAKRHGLADPTRRNVSES